MRAFDTESITIEPWTTMLDALRAVDRGGIGQALVTRDGRFNGIVTDGDLRRALINGADLTSPVEPYVNTSPTTMAPDESRDAALELLQARSFTAVPIVAHGVVVGVHTIRSLLGGRHRPNMAVIMAGGRGTRLGSLTKDTPKPMLPVAGRPILERIIHHLVGCGFERIGLAVNFRADVIEEHFGDGRAFGCDLTYLREREGTPLGTAGGLRTLLRHPEALEQSVLVINGDILTNAPLGDAIDHHEASRAHLTVGVTAHAYSVPFGVLETAGDRVVSIVEKPTVRWTVGAGVNILSPAAIRSIPEGYHDMTDLYAAALAEGRDLRIYPLDGGWIDIGRPTDLALARGEQ